MNRYLIAIVGLWIGVARVGAVVVITDPEGFIPILGEDPMTFFDLDGDDVDDVGLVKSGFRVLAQGEGSSRLLAIEAFIDTFHAFGVGAGTVVGELEPVPSLWNSGQVILSSCPAGGGGVVCSGEFVGGFDYLGIEFDISGQTHYGWMEIESSDLGARAFVHRWAYETEPGIPIMAGIPEPSAGVLLGFVAIIYRAARRRRRSDL
jgi:hypothetical protein